MMNRWIVALGCVTVLLAGCGAHSREQATIRSQLKVAIDSPAEIIDLTQIGPPAWSRFCAISPYSDNEAIQAVLGFSWDADENTSIQYSDHIVLLMFVDTNEVFSYVEYPRQYGDFADLSPSCLSRENAKVAKVQEGDWLRLVAAEQ